MGYIVFKTYVVLGDKGKTTKRTTLKKESE